MPTTAFAPCRSSLVANSLQREMPGRVEYFRILWYLSPLQALKRSADTAANTDRVGDIAKHKLYGSESGIYLAVELLTIC